MAAPLLWNPVPVVHGESGETLKLTPQQAGWEHLGFRALKLAPGDVWEGHTRDCEVGLVVLGGTCKITSSEGKWWQVGKRATPFDGLPYALYLPPQVPYTIQAESHLELAICSAPAEEVHPAHLITPSEVEVEIRGDGNATRQINHILKPEFPAQRLMLVEVITPSGNWSSYPPHKHDVHDLPQEADLEEIYYYKIDRPEGFAIQKVYTADRSLDVTLTVRDGELVLIPEGYHPVVAPPGYNVYYLNALAGSARTMAATDDPEFAWVRKTWNLQDQSKWLIPQEA